MKAHKESYFLICVCLVMFSFSSLMSSTGPLFCTLERHFNLNGMHRFGDVILGAIFEMNFFTAFSELYFTSEPDDPICHG